MNKKLNIPISFISRELALDKRALEKSKESLQKGSISEQVHNMHKSNLEPRIESWELALNILKSHNT